MRAAPGDHLIVNSNHVGQPAREAEILEVRGTDGAPPFVVRWQDGHTALVFPGADAAVRQGQQSGS